MKRGSTDSRGAEKRSAVGRSAPVRSVPAGLCRGLGALCTIPELPRWLEILFTSLGCGLSGSGAPRAVGAEYKNQEIGCAQSDLNQEEFDMLLVNIDYIPGKDLDVLGIVKGTVVQSKNFGKDLWRGWKTLVGGEITGYTEMLNEARQIAVKRMVDDAEAMGAGCRDQRALRIVLGDAGGGRRSLPTARP